MKKMQKVLTILVIAILTFGIMPQNFVMAANANATSVINSINVTNPDSELTSGLASTVGKLVGFLQVASGLVAVVMIAVVGFNYIISTPDVKEEMKKKMLPIIIGLVCVFGATSIARFVLGAVMVA